MDNIAFVDEENIPMVHEDDEDYDERYDTPNASRIETSFIEHDTTEATSTLCLRQKLTRDKIVSLCRYLSVTRDPGFADLDRFMIRKNSKRGNIELLFLHVDKHWQSLTNRRTGEFLAAKTLREKFGGLNIMKSVLSLDETPPALEMSLRAATKLKSELPTDLEMDSIPLKDPSSLAEDIHVKTREASQQTTLGMREFLAIDKALQSIQGELLNNTAKLKEIHARIERDTKKSKEVEK